MATKTILKSVSITGQKSTSRLAAALEKSANTKPKKVEVSKKVKELSSEAILAIWGAK